MAGLNFQTQTFINSNLDPDSGKGAKLFEAGENMLHIKREFQFWKDKEGYGKVLCINKKAGYEPKFCKATIDFGRLLSSLKVAGEAKTYCRLDIYLGVEGAEPFIYSTPWVQKGMPFWIEFTVKASDTAAQVAANLAKVIKKEHLFLCDKDLINVTVGTGDDAGKLILEGADEYQRFRKIELSNFGVVDDYANVVAELGDAGITLNERGLNGFGTYSQVIKDLRLPTAANYQWKHIRQTETPILGEIYDQYIIEYAAPAVNDGLHAVGQRMTSTTLHVFWVRHDENLIEEWEDALDAIGGVTNDYSLS